jgi:LAGLIDADG endonuclease
VKQLPHPWYVTGFAESRASFTYSRSGRVFALYFGIKVSAGDLGILQAVQAFFGGVGRIYNIKGSSDSVVNDGSFNYFRVNRARELAVLGAHFDRYPLAGARAQQYSVWREMVRLKQQFRKPVMDQLTALASRLSSLNRNSDTQS